MKKGKLIKSKLAKLAKIGKTIKSKFESHIKRHIVGVTLTLGILILAGAGSTLGPIVHKQYLYSKVGKVVVKTLLNARSGGTGFYVKAPSGISYILTNDHICDGAKNGIVFIKHESSSSPERFVPRKVIETSPSKDLCLVEGYGDNEGLSLASSVSQGDSVFVVGHPALQKLTVSAGVLMSKSELVQILYRANIKKEECEAFGSNFKYIEITDIFVQLFTGMYSACIKETMSYQSDAYIRPGNSGSPVTNVYGNLIGVAFAGDDWGFSYFVPLEEVKEFLEVY